MGLFKSKTRSVVGLDIEPGFVAAAEFSHNGGGPVLVRAATTSLGPGLFHEGEVVDVDALADRLKAFFKEHDLPKKVRLGVASQKMAVRVLELPAIENEQELDAAIRFQAQEELPMPLEQAVLDHRLLERIDDEQGGRMRILVVAARRDSVEHLLAAARRAGLTPELVDLSAFAMIRALYVPRHSHYPMRALAAEEDQFPAVAEEHDFTPAAGEHDIAAAPEEHEIAPAAEDPFAVTVEPQEEVDPFEEHESFGSGGYDLDAVTIEGPDGDHQDSVELAQPEHEHEVSDSDTDFSHAEQPVEAPAEDLAPAYEAPTVPTNGHGSDNGSSVAGAEPAWDEPAIDPESLGTVYCYVGGLTNLAIAVGRTCFFNRVLQNGLESMGATLAERRGLTLDHAREWLRHVGLERDIDRIEGEREIIEEARLVLQTGARRIADEVRLSIEYYHSTVPNAPRVENVVLAGPGIAIAGLANLLEQEVGLSVESRSMGKIEVRPGALDGVDGAHLTIATGLALDEVSA